MRRVLGIVMAALLLVGAGWTGTAAVAAADERDHLDLVLLLDGSGSIDAADWQLQLQGYAAALQDPVNFPLDGSMAVSIIQWSSVSSTMMTRVEVPLTVLDSSQDLASLVTDVQSIRQMNGGTNPGDAVVAGTVELVAHGRADATRALCMSTDGSYNGGASLSSATGYAKGSGVDRYSVVAIQDGSFSERAAVAAYGPYVFGGGTVTFARTTTEFTTLIGGCVADAISLEALEVTQVVQDLDNSIPLVANKSTVVRAYLSSTDGEQTRTTGRLRGFRNGAELPASPLTPVNIGPVLVDGDALSDRSDLADTLNFTLPPSWTTAGDVELALELPGGVTCPDPGSGPAACSVPVTFEKTFTSDVVFTGISWQDEGATVSPSFDDLLEQARRVRAQLPASTTTFAYRFLDVGDRPRDPAEINQDLITMTIVEMAPASQRWYGVAKGASQTTTGGQASGQVASGFLQGTEGLSSSAYQRNRAVHELGHTYGLHHSVNAEQNGYTHEGLLPMKAGWCDEKGSLSAPEYPFVMQIAGKDAAALGPSAQGRDAIWGMDARFVPGNARLALSSPTTTPGLMSYCGASSGSGQARWMDAADYLELIDGDRRPLSGWESTGAAGDGLLVRATFDPEGSALWQPAIPVETAPTVDDPSGTHRLVVLDAEGAELYSLGFTPSTTEADAAEEEVADAGGAALADLVLPAALGDVARIEIRSGETVLVQQSGSASAPTATVAAPTTGGSDTVDLRWQAADGDGDALSSTVLYSPDDGATWQVVALDQAGTELSVPRWALPASQQARLKVLVSDGLRTTAAVSEQFSLPNLAPVLEITGPSEGTRLSGAQSFSLTATAQDAEDGDLGGQIRWSSDRDGALGTGAEVLVRADELSEGEHVLTAQVTDSGAATTAARVTVSVRRIADQPEPEPTCIVDYVVHGTWPTGYTAQVWITNTGDDALTSWNLSWDLPEGESVGHHWSSTITMTGSAVTARNLDWNAVVDAGSAITFGLNGVLAPGLAPSQPDAFTLNGSRCA